MSYTLIPESAPFDETQRAWLNGFLSGFLGMQDGASENPIAMNAAMKAAAALNGGGVATLEAPESAEEDFPWKDDSLPILERVELSEGRPLERRLMSAMAQLDCGTCGYVCQTYSEAIANGDEKNLKLCTPGGKETSKMLKQLLKEGDAGGNGAGAGASNGASVTAKADGVGTELTYSRNNPFVAKIKRSEKLSKPSSDKHISHVEIDLSGSDLTYKVGDALGVYPTNCPDLVSSILATLAIEPDSQVATTDGPRSIENALTEAYDLASVSDEFLEVVVASANDTLKEKLAAMESADQLDDLDVLDLLELAAAEGAPLKITAQAFADVMSPIAPRLYSIASSLRKHIGQVHLTIGRVVTEIGGRERKGVASTMFSDRCSDSSSVRVFVQPSHGFGLPPDPQTPIIMVGPGTGIAPFRAFLQDRECENACGESWLFFGDQKKDSDFIYEEELSELLASEKLTRLDLAFSRDQAEKIYVQDRMRENAAELYAWIQRGAHFYVCGDAKRMASDVDKALHDIITEQAGIPAAEASAVVKDMKASGRYQRDVY